MAPCRTLRGESGEMCELLHTSAVVQKMQGGQKNPWKCALFGSGPCWGRKSPSGVDGRGKLAERLEVNSALSALHLHQHQRVEPCIFWTRPAGTCSVAPKICSLKPRPLEAQFHLTGQGTE